jgi:SpoIID/LytB domain protein
MTELYSTCWEDRDYPYLQAVPDVPEDGGKPFCDTDDEDLLRKVLNDYDLPTRDFYRWTVRCSRDELSNLINRCLQQTAVGSYSSEAAATLGMLRGGTTSVVGSSECETVEEEYVPTAGIGIVQSLKPLKRGPSGRIYELEVTGDKGRIILGKELAIRKALSPSCLKSSAFEIEWKGDECILHGRGWGHGVGLCQIGAAVMASKGYSCARILAHYYPGTEISRMKDE